MQDEEWPLFRRNPSKRERRRSGRRRTRRRVRRGGGPPVEADGWRAWLQEAIVCFSVLATITDLWISSGPRRPALPSAPLGTGSDGWAREARALEVRECSKGRRPGESRNAACSAFCCRELPARLSVDGAQRTRGARVEIKCVARAPESGYRDVPESDTVRTDRSSTSRAATAAATRRTIGPGAGSACSECPVGARGRAEVDGFGARRPL